MTTHSTDIAIIGAGPSGLFMVFEAGFLGYKCTVIDSLPEVGGQLAALYPEKPIYDIPGYPSILAGELVEKLVEQAAPYDPTYLLNNPVTDLEETEDGFRLKSGDETVEAKVIVLAGGGGVFTPRKPKLEHLEEFEENCISYAVKQKDQFKDQNIVIAGGGDSAADWAVELAKIVKHVHVVHRRPDFRAAEETVRQMHELAENGNITLHTPSQLKELIGENGQLSHIKIADFDENQTTLEADHLLCFFGLIPALGAVADWGLELESKKICVTQSTASTNKKGILAIGDIAAYEGKIPLILTGFSEAAIAAKTAQSIIDPDKKFKVVYSTSKGVSST